MITLHGLKGFDDLIVLRIEKPLYNGPTKGSSAANVRMRKWASLRPWVATFFVPHINFTLDELSVLLEKAWKEQWAENTL